ncbi:MAG: NAD(P)/FAD-dependent oxidoreductase [Beijerinckiaceae bacterium]
MSRSPLPHYAEPCGWNAMLPPRTPRAAAAGNITATYAIVGAGYTGLAAARRLHEHDPGASIVVLEGSSIGEGSSARNSGFANPRDPAFGLSPADMQRAEILNGYAAEGFESLRQIMAASNLDCDLRLTGRITGAATPRGEIKVRTQLDGARKQGVAHAFLDAKEMQERIGSPYYRCGFYSHEGYLLQPAALVRGIADTLPGPVTLHEQSPVMTLEKNNGWLLRTPHARIKAQTVILATNAAVKHFGYLRDRLVTIFTYAGITEDMTPADAAHLGAMPAWGLLPAHRLGTTVRRVGASRLMVRSLYAYEHPLPSQTVRDALSDCFHRRYPALSHIKLEYVWGGTTALTMNGSPFWGRLDTGLYASAGCNGSGIVKGTVLGRRLADLIAGTADEATLQAHYGQANWVAPEPFRTIGFHIVSALERRKASLEM